MKYLKLLLVSFVALFLSIILHAQAIPDTFNFRAVTNHQIKFISLTEKGRIISFSFQYKPSTGSYWKARIFKQPKDTIVTLVKEVFTVSNSARSIKGNYIADEAGKQIFFYKLTGNTGEVNFEFVHRQPISNSSIFESVDYTAIIYSPNDSCFRKELPGINFKKGSTLLTSDAKLILDFILKKIKYSYFCQLKISGHARYDNTQQKIIQKRINSITRYLTTHGFSKKRLIFSPDEEGDSSTVEFSLTHEEQEFHDCVYPTRK